jgi:hypothetical protein
VAPGELIDFQGEFRRQRDRTGSIFIYAYIVRPAPPTPSGR